MAERINPFGSRATLTTPLGTITGAYFRLSALAEHGIDLERMPVEDASVRWPENESSYLSVARLALPKQEAYSPARQPYFDDVLAFRPAHALEAHRPLGSIMRARLKTYAALSAFRHGRNGTPEREPRSIDEVPN